MPLRVYIPSSTANPTGFRPWNYKLSGLGCSEHLALGCNSDPNCQCASKGLGRVRRGRHLNGLGDATPDVGTLQAQANSYAAQLAQMNQDMVNLQNTIVSLSQQGIDMSSEGAQLLQQRNDYENIVAQFTTVYRALFGTTPPGLSALGIDPVTLAGIAAALAVIAGLIAVWWQHENALNAAAQAKLQNAQNISAAIAAGDTQTAAILASQTNAPTDFVSWFSQNWMYVAMAIGGVIVLQKL